MMGRLASRKGLNPGAFLAELLPVLKYIPAWLPGGSARRFAAEYKPRVEEMINKPYEEAKMKIVSTSVTHMMHTIVI